MAISKCGNCGSTGRWELSQVSPVGGNFRYYFIQCSNCGVPVTAVEYLNIGATVEQTERNLKSEIRDLELQLNNIETRLINIERRIK